jgi:hypothetical protein
LFVYTRVCAHGQSLQPIIAPDAGDKYFEFPLIVELRYASHNLPAPRLVRGRFSEGSVRMEINRKRALSVGLLLSGYSALLGGIFSLAFLPLVGVLVALGGLALTINSAFELVVEEQPSPEITLPPGD